MKPIVHALVVHYLNGEEFIDCVKSLQSDPLVKNITIIDNSNSIRALDFNFAQVPPVQVLRPKTNLGYAGGNNMGIKLAIASEDEYLLVINPDAMLPAGQLQKLVSELKLHDLGLISPKLQEPGSNALFESPVWDLLLGRGLLRPPRQSLPWANRYKSIFFGACFLARVDVFKDVGLLDQRLFLYGEELDFTFRMEKKAIGWMISSEATALHHRGKSTKAEAGEHKSSITQFHSARSMVINGLKFAPIKLLFWIASRILYAMFFPRLGIQSRISVIKGVLSGFVPK
jgi:GT2 family glycosyltransferase